jgi:murein DD-endopeptidase MepM/ murein hydrolase activator NlpD
LQNLQKKSAEQRKVAEQRKAGGGDAAGHGTAASGGSSAAKVSKGPPGPPSEPPVRSAHGRLLFPVPGGQIEARFGRAVDPRFGTVTLQRGIDVRAPEGAPVRAVHGGTVVHAGWFRGYGNLMIIDHGGGIFSLMAHLASLDRAVGDEVRRGDQLGTVGDTGSLKGSYLYFELRDGQKPFDPEPWLAKARVAAKKD